MVYLVSYDIKDANKANDAKAIELMKHRRHRPKGVSRH
jgi:hypothetical protein